MEIFDFSQWGSSDLVLLSRLIILFAWSWAAISTFKNRHLPSANQLLAGSLAMVASQIAPVLYPDLDYPTYLFFIAAAQVTLVSALLRLTQRHDVPKLVAQHAPAWFFFLAILLSSAQAAFAHF